MSRIIVRFERRTPDQAIQSMVMLYNSDRLRYEFWSGGARVQDFPASLDVPGMMTFAKEHGYRPLNESEYAAHLANYEFASGPAIPVTADARLQRNKPKATIHLPRNVGGFE